MTTYTLDIIANNGVPFRVVLLPDGKSINRPAANKYNTNDKPQVEFYDLRHPHTPDGQFTGACYYLDTLLEDPTGYGLSLYGGVDEWTVDAEAMVIVRTWLRAMIDRIRATSK